MLEWKSIERAGVLAGAVLGIYGAFQLTGFALNPPWAKADEIQNLQKQIDVINNGLNKITDRQETQDKRQLRVQRVQIAQQLREAQEDLRLNPNSISAARAVDDARNALSEIDRALASPSP